MYRMPALQEARAFPPGHPDGLRLSQVQGRQDSPCQAPEPQEALRLMTLRPMCCQGNGCLQHQRGTWGTAACSANRWLADALQQRLTSLETQPKSVRQTLSDTLPIRPPYLRRY